MLAHKASLNKLKKIKILQNVFLNTMEFSYKSLTIKYLENHPPKYLNNTVLNNSWAKDKIKGKLETILKCMTTKERSLYL